MRRHERFESLDVCTEPLGNGTEIRGLLIEGLAVRSLTARSRHGVLWMAGFEVRDVAVLHWLISIGWAIQALPQSRETLRDRGRGLVGLFLFVDLLELLAKTRGICHLPGGHDSDVPLHASARGLCLSTLVVGATTRRVLGPAANAQHARLHPYAAGYNHPRPSLVARFLRIAFFCCS